MKTKCRNDEHDLKFVQHDDSALSPGHQGKLEFPLREEIEAEQQPTSKATTSPLLSLSTGNLSATSFEEVQATYQSFTTAVGVSVLSTVRSHFPSVLSHFLV